jgi:CRP/FNR family transcriptional regulator, cyclic AMP receptor protein
MRMDDTRLQRAIATSIIGSLPSILRDQVLTDALPVDVPADGTIYREDDVPRCALVITGLVRVILSAEDGRTLTVRYARDGELLGVPAIVGGPVPVSVHMVTDTRLLMLNGQILQHLGKTEPMVGWMLAREVTQRLYDTLDAVADTAFGSLRQRVARHLLDLAIGHPDGKLVVAATQQELAEAVGSARPAVARVIGELRAISLVTTTPAGLVILDADGLHAQTWSRDMSHK